MDCFNFKISFFTEEISFFFSNFERSSNISTCGVVSIYFITFKRNAWMVSVRCEGSFFVSDFFTAIANLMFSSRKEIFSDESLFVFVECLFCEEPDSEEHS